MFKRPHLQILDERIKEPRNFIQVVLGPRQVGKTTMVTQLLKNIKMAYSYNSADGITNPGDVWIFGIWETARIKMKVQGLSEFLIVFDEIQKIENWSEIIKQQWDQDSREGINIKLIILGSSRLLIQKGLTESLAGRFETLYIGHWSFLEMNTAFNWTVEQYIYFGGYPGSVPLVNEEERWKNYIKDSLIETSIARDILMMTRIDKPALLKRLFELGSLYSGQILSFTKLMGQLHDAGNTTTLAHYLTVLSQSGLLGGLDKYSGNIIRIRSSSPKFQVFNNALLSAQDKFLFSEIILNPKSWGRYVESSVGSHLINFAVTERFGLYYWRNSNNEVDFVLENKGEIIALEVKSGKRIENPGMKKFLKEYPNAKLVQIGSGGIPISEFLKLNPKDLF